MAYPRMIHLFTGPASRLVHDPFAPYAEPDPVRSKATATTLSSPATPAAGSTRSTGTGASFSTRQGARGIPQPARTVPAPPPRCRDQPAGFRPAPHDRSSADRLSMPVRLPDQRHTRRFARDTRGRWISPPRLRLAHRQHVLLPFHVVVQHSQRRSNKPLIFTFLTPPVRTPHLAVPFHPAGQRTAVTPSSARLTRRPSCRAPSRTGRVRFNLLAQLARIGCGGFTLPERPTNPVAARISGARPCYALTASICLLARTAPRCLIGKSASAS